MEYTYSCCNKTTIFNGTKQTYNRKVRENRKCSTCTKIKIDDDKTYFKLDANGSKRKYVDVNCKECNKQLTIRYDSYKKVKNKDMCFSCVCKIRPTSFKTTQNGLSAHPIYRSWSAMRRRCYYEKNDNYKWYGGKGVSICEEWKDNFLNFFEWSVKNNWKDGLEIDRINSNGNYDPTNCRWITHKENCIQKFLNEIKE